MNGMSLFRKILPAMNLTFAFCFLVAAMALVTREVTGTELNETNISAHVNAQKQALQPFHQALNNWNDLAFIPMSNANYQIN